MIRAIHARALFASAILPLTLIVSGCDESDRTGPTPESTEIAEAPGAPAAAAPAGIVFASFSLQPSQLNTVHTGIVRAINPSSLLSFLSQVRAKKGRVLLLLSGGSAAYRNPDKTFNLTKWKAAVDRYRKVNFSSYVSDGTIVGHFVLDEPHYPSRWGNKVIPQATVEEAARHSKQLWPNLPTIVNAPLNWLASANVTYTHLDAGWALYTAGVHNSAATWIANQVAKAKQKKLGVFAGLNVLDGGNGSSGFHGNLKNRWAMSAAEVRSYGSALLGQSYVCGMGLWEYRSGYYGRADIKSALSDISTKARNHAKTSCRQ
jgi:hypothetical protein